MALTTIYPTGTSTVNIPATESIAISNYGGGIASIYYLIENANRPDAFQLQQTLENAGVVLGAFADGKTVKIEAGGSTVVFDVGASPDTGIGDADTLNGLASDTTDTADTIAARDSNGDIQANAFESTVSTGTAPFSVASTSVVTNLNADMVDGIEASQFLRSDANDFTTNTIAIGKASNAVGANLEIVGNAVINGVLNSNIARLILTRTDRSFKIANETSLRIYSATGENTNPLTQLFEIQHTTGDTTILGTLTVSGASGTINGNTIYHAGNDSNLAKLNGTQTLTGTNSFASGGIEIAASSGAKIYSGAGSPESAVTASPGSLYLNTSGGANTTLYVKESGTGNTGWIAK